MAGFLWHAFPLKGGLPCPPRGSNHLIILYSSNIASVSQARKRREGRRGKRSALRSLLL